MGKNLRIISEPPMSKAIEIIRIKISALRKRIVFIVYGVSVFDSSKKLMVQSYILLTGSFSTEYILYTMRGNVK